MKYLVAFDKLDYASKEARLAVDRLASFVPSSPREPETERMDLDRPVMVDVNEQLLISMIDAQATLENQAEILQAVKRHAELDALTRLPNRLLLSDRFAQAIAHARRHRGRCALLFLDIDGFKTINDRDGHTAGDQALRNAARRLLSSVRAIDTVSRFGGDEFVILVTEIASLADAPLIAAKVIAALATADGGGGGLAVSIGISVYPDDGTDPGLLIARADAAMYRAKRTRGGSFQCHADVLPTNALPDDLSQAADERANGTRAPDPLDRALRDTNERLLLTALRESEDHARTNAHLALALDAADMASWEADLATGSITCSTRYAQIFGQSPPRRVGAIRSMVRQFLPDERKSVVDAFRRALVDGHLDFEHRIVRTGDGQTRWLHVKGRLSPESEEGRRIAGVVTDVTSRRSTEEQLRQAQKMDAVGQLTGGIAHDFNNLLLVVGGSLDLLMLGRPAEERTDRLLASARRALANGARLNAQLLAFARRQNLQPASFAVDQRLAMFEDFLQRAVGTGIAIAIVCEPDLWKCLADPHQFDVALLNLAINARDAMQDTGRLMLTAGNRSITETHATTLGARAGDYVCVCVADTGPGMSASVMARAFEPFFTTKPVGRGTGLGLSQVYGFAKQSEGFVTLENGADRGTIATIYLPRSKAIEAGVVAERTSAADHRDE